MSKGRAGGDLRRFYVIFGVLAVIGIVAVGYTLGSRAIGGAVSEPVELEGVEDLRKLTEMAVGVPVGEDNAPASILVFGDYLCVHCATFSLRERPLVESELIESGKARMVFYDFPLNPPLGSFLAARAARCAGDQGRFWDYHDSLYRNQRSWASQAEKIPALEGLADQLGLDSDDFGACLNSDRHAEVVSANLELALALGLSGTPAVLVGSGEGMSRRLPNFGFETIKEAVESITGG